MTTNENTALAITLIGEQFDADGDPLRSAIMTQPSNGILSGALAPLTTYGAILTSLDLTYTPNANYSGNDSFTFKVNDGTADSATATVSIMVTAVNDPPVATAQKDLSPTNLSAIRSHL